jgi:hypothetical protein
VPYERRQARATGVRSRVALIGLVAGCTTTRFSFETVSVYTHARPGVMSNCQEDTTLIINDDTNQQNALLLRIHRSCEHTPGGPIVCRYRVLDLKVSLSSHVCFLSPNDKGVSDLLLSALQEGICTYFRKTSRETPR